MKLIYYGLFDKPSDCENWICEALTRAGVLVYRWQKWSGNAKTNWQDFIQYVKNENIGYVLISKAPELTPADLQQLKSKTGCKIIWWTFDWMNNPEVKKWYFPLAKVSDICFQTDGYGENDIYKREGINRIELHQAINPSIHYMSNGEVTSEEHKLYDADIAFFGSLYTPKRKKMDEMLRKKYGTKYKLWGGGAGFEKGLWNSEFRKAISCTKIVIGDNYTCDIPGYWSDRVYLTLGCGGFFLTSYVEGLDKTFGNDKLLTWTGHKSLLETVDYVLNKLKTNMNDRQLMIDNGYNFVHNNHTYDHRIKTFLKKIGELK